MFCYQCEQTAKGTGCTVLGVCGKQPEVAVLQDLLLYTLMGLSQVAVEGRKVGVSDREVNVHRQGGLLHPDQRGLRPRAVPRADPGGRAA